METVKNIFKMYGMFLKYTWRYFDLDNQDITWEKEDYVKAMDDHEKKMKKERDEKESKIFEESIMKK